MNLPKLTPEQIEQFAHETVTFRDVADAAKSVREPLIAEIAKRSRQEPAQAQANAVRLVDMLFTNFFYALAGRVVANKNRDGALPPQERVQ